MRNLPLNYLRLCVRLTWLHQIYFKTGAVCSSLTGTQLKSGSKEIHSKRKSKEFVFLSSFDANSVTLSTGYPAIAIQCTLARWLFGRVTIHGSYGIEIPSIRELIQFNLTIQFLNEIDACVYQKSCYYSKISCCYKRWPAFSNDLDEPESSSGHFGLFERLNWRVRFHLTNSDVQTDKKRWPSEVFSMKSI